ncbi:MAG: hypothetical protein V4594_21895 [Bacteroidota bacterium]
MQTSDIAILILLALDIVVLLLACWFDRRHYVPFLNMIKKDKEQYHNPHLIGVGLLAVGGGMLVFTLMGFAWIWMGHK